MISSLGWPGFKFWCTKELTQGIYTCVGLPWLICAYTVFAGVVSALSAWWIGRRAVAFEDEAVAAA